MTARIHTTNGLSVTLTPAMTRAILDHPPRAVVRLHTQTAAALVERGLLSAARHPVERWQGWRLTRDGTQMRDSLGASELTPRPWSSPRRPNPRPLGRLTHRQAEVLTRLYERAEAAHRLDEPATRWVHPGGPVHPGSLPQLELLGFAVRSSPRSLLIRITCAGVGALVMLGRLQSAPEWCQGRPD